MKAHDLLNIKQRSAPKLPTLRYENRLILFIDFLGFQEHIGRTITDERHLDRIAAALRALREVGMERELFESQQLTHFSDSVVVSFRIEETSAVFWLLNQIGMAVIEMAGSGFLVRGAVTVGPLVHTSDLLLGPAMVDAYRLESKVARFPRVIIDPKVIEVARRHRSDQHNSDEEEAYVRSGLAQDQDDWLWIDYVSWDAVLSAGLDADAYPEYLAVLSRMVRDGLAHAEWRVNEKMIWLHGEYACAVERCRALAPLEDEDLEQQRRFVAALPLFEELVATAVSKIAAEGKAD